MVIFLVMICDNEMEMLKVVMKSTIELNLLHGEEENILVSWLEIALQGGQWCRVWVVRLHLHGQSPTPTSVEIAVVLSLHSLPSSVGSLQF